MNYSSLLVSICLLFPVLSFAEKFQIIHTNDLHSHLEHAVHRPNLGGYGRIKVLMDKFRQNALDQGIKSIAVDAGDFLEGTLYYMADYGKKSTMAYNKLGFDVAVLGNHDYLMGAQDLENLLHEVPPSMNLLAANFKTKKDFPEIEKHIKPVWETTINGVKVGFIGITLNDMLFKWRLKGNVKIIKEVDAAKYWAKYLKQRGNQVIIAVTHIGVSKDQELAKNVPDLDLIVGGHSHDDLQEVVYQKSLNGKQIPIVQAGKFGEWVGTLMLDYDQSQKKLNVVNYKLHPVYSETKDQEVEDIISKANLDLENLYGKEWLEEVVGQSSLRPSFKYGQDITTWNFFINDSMLESVNADFAIHTTALSGDNYPIGNVTRRSLYDGNPRHFEFQNKYGYNVYSAKVSGMLIQLVATICLNFNLPLYISGISFQWKKLSNGKYKVWDIRHRGKKISLVKSYKVAFSEAIVRGGFGITPLIGIILQKMSREEISMWQALENKFRREGSITPDYLDQYYRHDFIGDGSEAMERVMIIPGND